MNLEKAGIFILLLSGGGFAAAFLIKQLAGFKQWFGLGAGAGALMWGFGHFL